MITDAVGKLYGELALICKKDAFQFVPEATIKIFNAILAEAKRTMPKDPILPALDSIPISAEVRYADLLVRIGQISAAISQIDPGLGEIPMA